jgi:hypothetical protein
MSAERLLYVLKLALTAMFDEADLALSDHVILQDSAVVSVPGRIPRKPDGRVTWLASSLIMSSDISDSVAAGKNL